MSRRGENIRKRKDGRWEGRYCTPGPQNGKNVIRSVYARSYGEVKEKLFSAKSAVLSNEKRSMLPDGDILFWAVAEEWLKTVKAERKHSTYIKYYLVCEKHLKEKIGNCSLLKLEDGMLIDSILNESKEIKSDSLQKSIICVINQIFAYASRHYNVGLFHYSRQRQKTTYKPVEVLNQAEQTRLLQYLYDEMDIYKLGIVICISTGLRLGEICSLKWKDIDMENKILYVNMTVQRIAAEGYETKSILQEGEPKSLFSKREIPLSDELIRLLSLFNKDTGAYVINSKKPMEPRTYQNKFQKYLKDAGIDRKNFHILRHTFATNCISNGIDVKSLSEILGHSDVKITLNRYVHPSIETKRQHMNSLFAIYGQIIGSANNKI